MQILVNGIPAKGVTAEIEKALEVLEGLVIRDVDPASHLLSSAPGQSTAFEG